MKQIDTRADWWDVTLLRQKIAEFGHVKMVILLTVVAILLSVGMTLLLWMQVFQREFDWVPVIISTVVPATVCPLLMWYVIGVTLDLHRLESQMRYLASYDTLTQVSTRRAFLNNFSQRLQLAMQNKTGLAVAYLDLDDFKRINDRYRHAMGDQVLTQFAAVIRDNMRKSDPVGRMGGEEFALVISDISVDAALQVLEKLRQKTAQLRFSAHESEFGITVSIGMSYLKAGEVSSVDQLLHEADNALSRAKKSGKNCVVDYASLSS